LMVMINVCRLFKRLESRRMCTSISFSETPLDQACNANQNLFFAAIQGSNQNFFLLLYKEVFGIVVQFPSLQERALPKFNGGKGCM